MGLRDGPLKLEPGARLFCFRIAHGKRVFETATFRYATLAQAFEAVRKCYPAATVSALSTGPLAPDGLPALQKAE